MKRINSKFGFVMVVVIVVVAGISIRSCRSDSPAPIGKWQVGDKSFHQELEFKEDGTEIITAAETISVPDGEKKEEFAVELKPTVLKYKIKGDQIVVVSPKEYEVVAPAESVIDTSKRNPDNRTTFSVSGDKLMITEKDGTVTYRRIN